MMINDENIKLQNDDKWLKNKIAEYKKIQFLYLNF